MILYLLLAFLMHGVVKSQTANVTELELSKAEGNQTSTESDSNNNTRDDVIWYSTHQEIPSNNFSLLSNMESAAPAANVTSSVYKDKKNQIEEELKNNQTSFPTEDDENFQEQENEIQFKYCDQDLLANVSHTFCGEDFHTEMKSISTENWCVLENIIRPYYNMSKCLEKLSGLLDCYYPNPSVQDFFLDIHSLYFHNCSNEDLLLVDAPQWLVITLTVIPVSFIPVLVYLVIWQGKVEK